MRDVALDVLLVMLVIFFLVMVARYVHGVDVWMAAL